MLVELVVLVVILLSAFINIIYLQGSLLNAEQCLLGGLTWHKYVWEFSGCCCSIGYSCGCWSRCSFSRRVCSIIGRDGSCECSYRPILVLVV